MKFFFTWFRLVVKAELRSPVFLTACVFLLSLTAALALIAPAPAPESLTIGVYTKEEAPWFTETFDRLLRNEDYDFVRYEDEEQMRREIARGALHCGYFLRTGDVPIVSVVSDGSFMSRVVDEVVLSAYINAAAPERAASYLTARGIPAGSVESYVSELLAGEPLMKLSVSPLPGGVTNSPDDGPVDTVSPVLYAVLISLFLAVCLVCGLARGEKRKRFECLLAISGHPKAAYIAPAVSRAVLFGAALFLADEILFVFAPFLQYGRLARFVMIVNLSLLGSLLGSLGASAGRAKHIFFAALPLVLLVWILFSGALLSPSLFPGKLPLLRFLSPPWYLLRMMSALS